MSGNGDYISREAVLDLLQRAITMSTCLSVEECKAKILQQEIDIDLVKSIPAADVQPVVRAHWVENTVAFYRGCPECGAFVRANLDEVFLLDFPSAVGKMNFCPNCGARMEEN